MELPVLTITNRNREYLLWNKYIYDIVYSFLFLGKTHREIDREVLNQEKPNGFQSMAVLHYLGLVKEYRNIFHGISVLEAINIMRIDEKSDYSKIINILSVHNVSESDKENRTNIESLPIVQEEVVINAIKKLGGMASLQQIYDTVDFSVWRNTKLSESSIRTTLQQSKSIYKMKPGIWALKDNQNIVLYEDTCLEQSNKPKNIVIKLKGNLK